MKVYPSIIVYCDTCLTVDVSLSSALTTTASNSSYKFLNEVLHNVEQKKKETKFFIKTFETALVWLKPLDS